MLRAVGDLTREQGFAPSLREIAGRVGLKSPTVARYHLQRLTAAELAVWTPTACRTARLTPNGARHLTEGTCADPRRAEGREP